MKIKHQPIQPAAQAVSLEEVVRALIQALEDAKIKLPPLALKWARQQADNSKADNNRA